MFKATIEGKEVELKPEELTPAGDGYAIITPEKVPDGFVKQTAMEAIISQRIHTAKTKAMEDAVKDKNIHNQVLESYGIALKDGKPVGVEPADMEGLKKQLHREIKTQLEDEYKPFKQSNSVLRGRIIQGELKSQAIAMGMSPAFAEMFASHSSGNFGLDDNGTPLQKDGTGFKIDPSTGEHVTATKFMDAVSKDPAYKDFFPTRHQPGVGGTGSTGNQSTNLGNIKAKSQFKSTMEKAQYIAQFGRDAFESLPKTI